MPRPTFPKSFPEFVKRFPDEEACFQYIIDSRWPDGFVCARCGHDEAYAYIGKWNLRCKNCRKVHSATAGTVMHRTRQPLCLWLWAAYLMVTDKIMSSWTTICDLRVSIDGSRNPEMIVLRFNVIKKG